MKISIIIPVFNEEPNIIELNKRLAIVLKDVDDYEVIFVDDGSNDKTLAIIKSVASLNTKIKYLSFSRNFGHQNALRAGLAYSSGDCTVSMDSDLQHPPELIHQMIEKWKDGYKIVYTIRKQSRKVSIFKRKTSNVFYRVISKLSDISLPKGAADFRLLDKEITDIIVKMNENALFLRGMISWIGFDQYAIEYEPEERFAGKTKYSFKKMVSFAITGLTSFSIKPLRISTILGAIIAALSFVYAFYAVYIKIFTSESISGWTSILVSVLFLAGIQLLTVGIIGEYIGKIFIESKGRPNYIIKEKNL